MAAPGQTCEASSPLPILLRPETQFKRGSWGPARGVFRLRHGTWKRQRAVFVHLSLAEIEHFMLLHSERLRAPVLEVRQFLRRLLTYRSLPVASALWPLPYLSLRAG